MTMLPPSRSTDRVAAADGCAIAYRFDGPADAPVVLLANSLGTDLSLFDGQVAQLAGRWRVLRYDMRGHGGSETTPGEATLARLALDAVDLLDALGIATVSLCGVSLGGMVGQWLAVERPGRIDRLVLANTSAHMPPASAWQARIEAVRTGGLEPVVDQVLARWFTPAFLARDPAVVARIRERILGSDPAGYAAACAAIRDMDLRGTIGRIRAPTLVIGGESDTATPPDHAAHLAAAIPGARLAMLPAAHLANLEQPAAFNELVGDFLASG